VVNINISKNESKSQLFIVDILLLGVVVNISISKNESKSQQRRVVTKWFSSCGKYQYFKE